MPKLRKKILGNKQFVEQTRLKLGTKTRPSDVTYLTNTITEKDKKSESFYENLAQVQKFIEQNSQIKRTILSYTYDKDKILPDVHATVVNDMLADLAISVADMMTEYKGNSDTDAFGLTRVQADTVVAGFSMQHAQMVIDYQNSAAALTAAVSDLTQNFSNAEAGKFNALREAQTEFLLDHSSSRTPEYTAKAAVASEVIIPAIDSVIAKHQRTKGINEEKFNKEVRHDVKEALKQFTNPGENAREVLKEFKGFIPQDVQNLVKKPTTVAKQAAKVVKAAIVKPVARQPVQRDNTRAMQEINRAAGEAKEINRDMENLSRRIASNPSQITGARAELQALGEKLNSLKDTMERYTVDTRPFTKEQKHTAESTYRSFMSEYSDTNLIQKEILANLTRIEQGRGAEIKPPETKISSEDLIRNLFNKTHPKTPENKYGSEKQAPEKPVPTTPVVETPPQTPKQQPEVRPIEARTMRAMNRPLPTQPKGPIQVGSNSEKIEDQEKKPAQDAEEHKVYVNRPGNINIEQQKTEKQTPVVDQDDIVLRASKDNVAIPDGAAKSKIREFNEAAARTESKPPETTPEQPAAQEEKKVSNQDYIRPPETDFKDEKIFQPGSVNSRVQAFNAEVEAKKTAAPEQPLPDPADEQAALMAEARRLAAETKEPAPQRRLNPKLDALNARVRSGSLPGATMAAGKHKLDPITPLQGDKKAAPTTPETAAPVTPAAEQTPVEPVPTVAEVKPDEPVMPVVDEVKPDAPVVPTVDEVKSDEPVVPTVDEVKPDEPEVPTVDEVKPDVPEVLTVDEVKPDEPEVPAVDEIKPDEPTAPTVAEVEPVEPSVSVDEVTLEVNAPADVGLPFKEYSQEDVKTFDPENPSSQPNPPAYNTAAVIAADEKEPTLTFESDFSTDDAGIDDEIKLESYETPLVTPGYATPIEAANEELGDDDVQFKEVVPSANDNAPDATPELAELDVEALDLDSNPADEKAPSAEALELEELGNDGIDLNDLEFEEEAPSAESQAPEPPEPEPANPEPIAADAAEAAAEAPAAPAPETPSDADPAPKNSVAARIKQWEQTIENENKPWQKSAAKTAEIPSGINVRLAAAALEEKIKQENKPNNLTGRSRSSSIETPLNPPVPPLPSNTGVGEKKLDVPLPGAENAGDVLPNPVNAGGNADVLPNPANPVAGNGDVPPTPLPAGLDAAQQAEIQKFIDRASTLWEQIDTALTNAEQSPQTNDDARALVALLTNQHADMMNENQTLVQLQQQLKAFCPQAYTNGILNFVDNLKAVEDQLANNPADLAELLNRITNLNNNIPPPPPPPNPAALLTNINASIDILEIEISQVKSTMDEEGPNVSALKIELLSTLGALTGDFNRINQSILKAKTEFPNSNDFQGVEGRMSNVNQQIVLLTARINAITPKSIFAAQPKPTATVATAGTTNPPPNPTGTATPRHNIILKKLPTAVGAHVNQYIGYTGSLSKLADQLTNTDELNRAKNLMQHIQLKLTEASDPSKANLETRQKMIDDWNNRLFPLLEKINTRMVNLLDVNGMIQDPARRQKIVDTTKEYHKLYETLYGNQGVRSSLQKTLDRYAMDTIALKSDQVTRVDRTPGETDSEFKKRIDDVCNGLFTPTTSTTFGIQSSNTDMNVFTQAAICCINGDASDKDPLDHSNKTFYTVETGGGASECEINMKKIRDDMDPQILLVDMAIKNGFDKFINVSQPVQSDQVKQFFANFSENPPTKEGIKKYLIDKINNGECSLTSGKLSGNVADMAGKVFDSYIAYSRDALNHDVPHQRTMAIALDMVQNFVNASGGNQKLTLMGSNEDIKLASKLICAVMLQDVKDPDKNFIFKYRTYPREAEPMKFSSSALNRTRDMLKAMDPNYAQNLQLMNLALSSDVKNNKVSGLTGKMSATHNQAGIQQDAPDANISRRPGGKI